VYISTCQTIFLTEFFLTHFCDAERLKCEKGSGLKWPSSFIFTPLTYRLSGVCVCVFYIFFFEKKVQKWKKKEENLFFLLLFFVFASFSFSFGACIILFSYIYFLSLFWEREKLYIYMQSIKCSLRKYKKEKFFFLFQSNYLHYIMY